MKRLAAVACLSACLPSGRQIAHGPILDKRQKQWFQEAMRGSSADFLFIVSSVNMMAPHIRDTRAGEEFRAAYARPQAVFQYCEGLTGDFLYAETVRAAR